MTCVEKCQQRETNFTTVPRPIHPICVIRRVLHLAFSLNIWDVIPVSGVSVLLCAFCKHRQDSCLCCIVLNWEALKATSHIQGTAETLSKPEDLILYLVTFTVFLLYLTCHRNGSCGAKCGCAGGSCSTEFIWRQKDKLQASLGSVGGSRSDEDRRQRLLPGEEHPLCHWPVSSCTADPEKSGR